MPVYKDKEDSIYMLFILLLTCVIFILIVSSTECHSPTKPVGSAEYTAAALNDNYELDLVKADLDTYGTLSEKVKKLIIDNIADVHRNRHIPIGLMHCIFRVESDYRFNIDHPDVMVKVGQCKTIKGNSNNAHLDFPNRMIKTHATGMAGIVWYFWKDSLIANGIAEKESDLYLPDVSVQACGLVLSIQIKEIMSTSAVAPGHDLIDRLICAYYGAYCSLYRDKMQKITSDLWLIRMSKDILREYRCS
jgi:hypothetical protein